MTRDLPPDDLLPWALSVLTSEGPAQLEAIAGDASARRYFRLRQGERSFIAVEAPPESQKNHEFLAIQKLLLGGGIRVPALYGADLARGFMLLEDFGDRLLLDELNSSSVDGCYRQAFELLQLMGDVDPGDPCWPRYDDALFSEELSRFPQWFVQSLLGVPLPEETLWRAFAECLKANALAQPTVLVHRDFHSRNLMPQADGALGLIDFQDAVIGPVTYDLVSLLRDCYIRWQPEQVEAWALEYLQMQQRCGKLVDVEPQQFLRWFDLMGLQRHIKVLGTFARLYLRDQKPSYLADLPLVIRYVQEMLSRYRGELDQIDQFASWFDDALMPAIRQQAWSQEP